MAMNFDVNNLSSDEKKINNDKKVETSEFILSDHILTSDKLLDKLLHSQLQLETLKKEHEQIVLKLEDKSEMVENLTTSLETVQKTNDFLRQRIIDLPKNIVQRDSQELNELHDKLEKTIIQLESLRLENQGLKNKNAQLEELVQQQKQNPNFNGKSQKDYQKLEYLLQTKEDSLNSLKMEYAKLQKNLYTIKDRLTNIEHTHNENPCEQCKSNSVFGLCKCSFSRGVQTLLNDVQKLISPTKTNYN